MRAPLLPALNAFFSVSYDAGRQTGLLKSGRIKIVPLSRWRKLFCAVIFSVMILSSEIAQGQQWTILGNENQISTVSNSYTSIGVIDNVPYVFSRENTTLAAIVQRRNPVSGAWEQVGNVLGTNVTYTRLFVDKANNLYATYLEASNNKLAVKSYNADSQTWQPLHNDPANLYVSTGSVNNTISQYSSTPRCSMAFDSNNIPYIAYGESSNLTPIVRKFVDSTWVTVGGGAVVIGAHAVALSLAIDDTDIPWLTYCSLSSGTATTGNMALFSNVNGSWISVPVNITGIRHTSMALNSASNPVIAYFNTGNNNRATVITYNRATSAFGSSSALSTRDAPNISVVNDLAGNVYCSFIDFISSTAHNQARVFKQDAGTTTWKELKDPAISGIDEPTSGLTIAIDNTTPYIVYTKANSSGVNTPIVRMYTPPASPVAITTTPAGNFSPTSATVGGNITANGGSPVTERGVVYAIAKNPTLTDFKVLDTLAGSGAYTVKLNGLSPATLYYVRAYAINGNGANISYGDNVRISTLPITGPVVTGPKQMEFLKRGLVALRKSPSTVFLSWRLLGTEPSNIAFNVYRDSAKLNASPITNSTNYLDTTTTNGNYKVRAVINGVEGVACAPVPVWNNNQLVVPIQIPPGGTLPNGVTYTYSANDCSVGDVDGDGEYEIFLKWDPSVLNINEGGYSGNQIIDCYKLDGTRLWRINLGININSGPHYTQFMVYDFDGDGKAEMICKTADGTIDGTGKAIGNAQADYRSTSGWVQTGPEYLTVFNGQTGAAMATVNYEPARGNISDWGDTYGNRADRFVSAVAYLDGVRPSAVIGRGYYDKLVRAAYDWRDGKLTLRWKFDSKDPAHPSYNAFSGQGNHQMTIGDVDGDGKDEVINGSSAIDDDGKPLWTYGNGHGDALHMTDMDPSRPGQEIWINLESPGSYDGMGLRMYDAATGQTLWGVQTSGDIGRSMAADIDPTHPGYEVWGSSGNLYDVKGNQINTNKPSYNTCVWWDGDLGRELLDGTVVDRWNYQTNTSSRAATLYNEAPVSANNDTKKNACLTADLFGDWREEIMLRRSDNTALVIFTTNIPTDKRIYTLMHDPQYRTAVAWQNSGYNQPPYPSFYLGYGMADPPAPNIEVKYLDAPTLKNKQLGTRAGGCDTTIQYNAEASGFPAPTYTYTLSGATSGSGSGTGSGNLFNKGTTTISIVASNTFKTVSYNFNVTVVDSIKPKITAPDSVFVQADSGQAFASQVILGSPVTADNCMIDSVTNNAPSTFPIGIMTVKWTVRDQSGNTSTANQIVTVTKRDQTISFASLTPKTYGDSDFQLVATSSSGLPVSYTSSDSSVLVINGNLAHIKRAGNVTILAEQIGNGYYSAAEQVSQQQIINKAPATITVGNLAQAADGTPKEISVQSTPVGLTGFTITYSGSPAPPSAPGSYAVQVILQNDNFEAQPVSATLVIAAFVKVQYKDGDGIATNNQGKPQLKIVNTGSAAIAYSELTVRYWITPENYTGLGLWIDYAQIGNGKVTVKYVPLDNPRAKALGYIEYGFTSAAGNLSAGSNSGVIESRFANTDYSVFNESNDYSFANSPGYAENTNITLYRNGHLIWGTEPVSETSVVRLKAYTEAKSAATSNTISTYLDIRNEGNTPVNYSDITARYWFSPEGSSLLNFYVDYAKIGNSAVSGSFKPANGAGTTYLELKANPSSGVFYPLSATGNTQYRIAKSDWSVFNQANDYSYQLGQMSENNKVTLYYKGQLIYGTEPVSMASFSAMSYGASNDVQVTPSSTDDIVLYPNPATQSVNVRLNNDQKGSVLIQIYSTLNGALVKSATGMKQGAQFDTNITLDNLRLGVYTMVISIGNYQKTKSLVIAN